MFTDDLLSAITLTLIPGFGDKILRQLLEHYGSVAEVMQASRKSLIALEGMGEGRAAIFKKALEDPEIHARAATEMRFITEKGIQVLLQNDAAYPTRLRQCVDAPFLLYYKGEADLNTEKTVSIIGTRKPSDYGTQLCEELVSGLAAQGVLVVSGLAHGVDTTAHRQSVQCGLKTVGVVAHGLDLIYPPANRNLAKEMVEQGGGILTEFTTGTKPDKGNFPIRNRIVAGMSDVTVVVESDIKGGAMITAYLAHGYNREVAAFPGRVGDSRAAGCNLLIRRTIAALITNADDLCETLGWTAPKQKAVQPKLMLTFSPEEHAIVNALQEHEKRHADDLLLASSLDASMLASVLLQLEMQGIIRSLPGKNYRLA